jgi:hypothetical protein
MAKRREDMQPLEPVTTIQSPKIDFDAWWAMVEKKIPTQHRKEIIKADFRARGFTLKESTQSYNEALKKYGVKLN